MSVSATLRAKYRKIVEQLERRELEEPVQEEADESCLRFAYHSGDQDFFRDFELFGKVFNKFRSESNIWRLGEKRGQGAWMEYDGPLVYRNYTVYFSKTAMGVLGICPGLPKYTDAEPNIWVELQLEYLQFLEWVDATSLLASVSALLGVNGGYEKMAASLVPYLWEVVRRPDELVQFRWQADGKASHYLKYKEEILARP
jgi:hypothetical protein